MGIRDKLAGCIKDRRTRRFLDFHETLPLPGRIGEGRYAVRRPSARLWSRQRVIVGADPNFYAEDFGTFLLLRRQFEQHACVADEAAAVVFLFNLGCLHSKLWRAADQALFEEEIGRLRQAAGPRPLIFLSLGDHAYARTRTTYPEILIQGADLQQKFAWLAEADRLVQFECTRDHSRDVPAYPLLACRPLSPFSRPRCFLFSFVGSATKDHWAPGFVRSPGQQQCWRRLQREYAAVCFIGDERRARRRGFSQPFRQVPAHSTFSLCPRGSAAWSFRLFEAILAGSIPVILADAYRLPFAEQIDWASFSLQLEERSLPEVPQILIGMHDDAIAALQRGLLAAQHHFGLAGLWRNILADLARGPRGVAVPDLSAVPGGLGMPVPDEKQCASRRLVNTLAVYDCLVGGDDQLASIHIENFLAEDRDGPPTDEPVLLAAADQHRRLGDPLAARRAIQFPRSVGILRHAAQVLGKNAFAQAALSGVVERDFSPARGGGLRDETWRRDQTTRPPNFAVAEALLERPVLAEVIRQLVMARWQARADGAIATELVAHATPTLLLLHTLINADAFVSVVERTFGLPDRSIHYACGRLYRLRPGPFDADSWHDDIKVTEGRCLALVISLAADGFAGGDWVMREKASKREVGRVSLALPGRALIFRVAPELEHRVEAVEGARPRDVFAGWLRQKPLRGRLGY